MEGGWLTNKFCLLLWKNYILQTRHPGQTAFEILSPLIFAMLLIFARTVAPPGYEKPYESENSHIQGQVGTPEVFYPNYTKLERIGKVLYAPNTSEFEGIMEETKLELRQGFIDEDTLLKEYEEIGRTFAAVIFKSGQRNEISYRLRFPQGEWETQLLYSEFPLPQPRRHFYRSTKEHPGYQREGFLDLQWAIDTAIIQTMVSEKFRVSLKQYPFPIFIDQSHYLKLLRQVSAWLLMFSYMYSVASISKSIVNEREQRLRESMKMMGLPSWLHWSAWLAKSLVLLGISAILMTFIYKVPLAPVNAKYGQLSTRLAILNYADGFLLFVFLLAYVFSLITFGFLVASICSKSKSSATAATFLYLLSFLPYFVANESSSSLLELSRGMKLGISLLSNSAMGFGMHIIAKFEGAVVGIQWNNIAHPVTPDDNISFLHIMAMLILDGFLYLFLAIYIEAVFPGEFGIPSPWYFPIMPSYWTGGTPTGASMKVEADGDEPPQNLSGYFEKEPSDATIGIKIMNLRKVFGHKVAVDGLKLNFYENQVTALLGHNGAGKTTTMSMITGLYQPTSGTAIVNGFDIRNQIGWVHKSLGICPQHNVLFDELTVEEHLKFFCLLKGYSGPVEAEINRMLVSLNLVDKRDARSDTLSGGMKRKLSVGLAFIGGSRVVLLDEPTAGMDPGARRSAWDLITSERQGKTILLSTHFMDEADLLGDRIAILAHGKAVCCGSSLFLKRKYGGGYHLTMVKEPNCQVSRITELLQQHIPEVDVDQNIGTELSYSLPDGKVSIFPAVFEELEKRKAELGVSSYGCSITRMEEVFIRAGEQVEKEMKGMAGQSRTVPPSTHALKSQPEIPSTQGVSSENAPSKSIVPSNQEVNLENNDLSLSEVPKLEVEAVEMCSPEPSTYPPNRGCALQIQQLRAMIVKKWLHALGNKSVFIVNALLPAAFLIMILVILAPKPTSGPDSKEAVERPLDLRKYRDPVTVLECSVSPEPDICRSYADHAKSQSAVINTGNIDIEDYIMDKIKTSGLYEVNSNYIVGLRVTMSSDEEAEKGSRKGKHKRATPENATGSQETNEKGSGAAGLPRESGVQSTTNLMLNGFFNLEPFHAAPVALNFISNALLQTLSPGNKITLTNYPLPLPTPRNEGQDHSVAEVNPNSHFLIPMSMTFTMAFLAATFVLFPIKERESKAKHLQFVSGAQFPIFWLGHFLFDALYHIIVCIILVVVVASFHTGVLDSATGMILFFLVLVSYGWAVIPMSYLFSFLFSNPSWGYVLMGFFYWMTGVVCVTIFLLCDDGPGEPSKIGSFFCALIKIPSMLVPSYNLFLGIFNIIHNELRGLGVRVSPGSDKNEKSVAIHIIAQIVSGLIYLIWILIIEWRIYRRRSDSRRGSAALYDSTTLEDSDVAAENERIRNTDIAEVFLTDTMVLKDLTKYYDNFLAVDRLCLGVRHGECFGLLGINGAGKTTTFMMLTGDVSISSGDAFITGKSVTKQLKEVQKVIGYCPQFDAIIPELTGAETIRLYARLRGVHESAINDLIDLLAEDLLLTEYIRNPCGTYSGGNKRKLSTAMSLVGNPALVFLDEPTAGLDPVARRHLWNTVIKIREAGTSVILTSHSMDECEALCTRLAIMVNGKFRCLGSTQHLKNKFGDGYTIIAQLQAPLDEQPKRTRTSLETGRRRQSLKPEAWELYLQPLRHFIETNFPECQIKDMHPCYVHYHIPNGSTTWSAMFTKMEEAKALFQLEAYSVGQTSLEQVFLGFAKGQYKKDEGD